MSVAETLDKEINEYLLLLNATQKQAVLSVVKTFAHEEKSWWNDKSYLTEMNKRFDDLENNKIKGVSIEDLETTARVAYKKKKSKNS